MEKVRNIIHGSHDPYAGFEPMPPDIQGWASTSEAFKQCIDKIKPKLIVEVGTWKGASAIYMSSLCMEHGSDFEIVCVDTFLGSVEHWTTITEFIKKESLINGRPNVYNQFLSNVISVGLQNNITPFPIDSVNGALTLSHFDVKADMVYIDAGHDYDSVVADLILYKDIVRPGGLLLGDDWFHGPIKQAVSDALGEVHTLSHDKFLWVKPE
jgi:hypothetical protein